MDKCLLSILPATAYMLSMLISLYFQSFGGKGDTPGQFNQPHGLAFDSSGNSYVSDSMNHRIQKFMMEGDLLKIFGNGDGFT